VADLAPTGPKLFTSTIQESFAGMFEYFWIGGNESATSCLHRRAGKVINIEQQRMESARIFGNASGKVGFSN